MALATLTSTGLIETIAVGLSAALVGGFLARLLGLSPIVGYMLAGVAVGPYTPGFVADQELAAQLSEIGIALLMFGVGLHFSLADLLAVRRIAVPGAVVQSLLATAAGVAVAAAWGWSLAAGLVFGLALSVASTVVLVRGLTDHRLLSSPQGHAAIGWLVVEDLFTVLILVALPALAATGDRGLGATLATTSLKMTGLAAVYVVGKFLVPRFLLLVAKLRSRELFTLAVLAIALGVAWGSAELFSVSMALGAFLGGMVVGQSELSHQAAADALPLRDAFAVLFFVAVGMLFDPSFLVQRPLLVAATLAVILLVKPIAALGITLLLGHPVRTAVTVAAGLAQIGEFSFIVGALGRDLGLLNADAQQAIVASAMICIALNPLAFRLMAPAERLAGRLPGLARWLARTASPAPLPTPAAAQDGRGPTAPMQGHAVLCGHGRVGSVLAKALRARGIPLLVIEENRATVQRLRADGVTTIQGDAANEFVLERALLPHARLLLVTLPDPIATRQVVDLARRLHPGIEVVARVHTESERTYLERAGVDGVNGELELAVEMVRHAVGRFGVSALEAQAIALDLRRGGQAAADGARVLEVAVGKGSATAGKSIAELQLGRGALVMAIERAGDLVVPDGATRLAEGDTLLVVAARDAVERVLALQRD